MWLCIAAWALSPQFKEVAVSSQSDQFTSTDVYTWPQFPPPSGLWAPTWFETPISGDYVYLETARNRTAGDWKKYVYTKQDDSVEVDMSSEAIAVMAHKANSHEEWNGSVQLSVLGRGFYGNCISFPSSDSPLSGISWYSTLGHFDTMTGWLVIEEIIYVDEKLASIVLVFELIDEETSQTLRGKINWHGDASHPPPGPVYPPPSHLWQPNPASLPTDPNLVYIEGKPNEMICQENSYIYTPNNASISITSKGNHLSITVNSTNHWECEFHGMDRQDILQPGYYGDLMYYPHFNPAKGGLLLWVEYFPCYEPKGWFVVDEVTYQDGALEFISMRFEEYCNMDTALLHGVIRWNASSPISPPKPVFPAPLGLWTPPPDSLPVGKNIIYLESEEGDSVGRGETHTFDVNNAILEVEYVRSILLITITGDFSWSGWFEGMKTISHLQPGFYGDLSEERNGAKGSIYWQQRGLFCHTTSGWFVIDSISISESVLESVVLRFEHYCDGANSALRGAIQWSASNPSTPSGPVYPPPSSLWRPDAGVIPAKGNFVYLESDPGDLVASGNIYLYTSETAKVSMSSLDNWLDLSVSGQEEWTGMFAPMVGLDTLRLGYYEELSKYSLTNPAKGKFAWIFNGSLFWDMMTGWFTVDEIEFAEADATAVTIRFEQKVEGASGALRGMIRWSTKELTLQSSTEVLES